MIQLRRMGTATSPQKVSPSTHLPVDGANDGSPQSHPSDKAVLKVLVQNKGLQQGAEEHQEGKGISPPRRDTILLIAYEGNQHAAKRKP